jgi:hypothetical protein
LGSSSHHDQTTRGFRPRSRHRRVRGKRGTGACARTGCGANDRTGRHDNAWSVDDAGRRIDAGSNRDTVHASDVRAKWSAVFGAHGGTVDCAIGFGDARIR